MNKDIITLAWEVADKLCPDNQATSLKWLTAYDAALAMAERLTANQWISVLDELPKEGGMYLTYWNDGTLETFGYEADSDLVWGLVDTSLFVTHWQKLPEPPKATGEGE